MNFAAFVCQLVHLVQKMDFTLVNQVIVILVPTLVSYVFHGPYSLNAFLALQYRPFPVDKKTSHEHESHVEESSVPCQWIDWQPDSLFAPSFIMFLWSSVFMNGGGHGLYSWLWICSISAFFTPAVAQALLVLSGTAKLAVSRDAKGVPVLHLLIANTAYQHAKELLVTFVSCAIAFYAFAFSSVICRSLVLVASLYTAAPISPPTFTRCILVYVPISAISTVVLSLSIANINEIMTAKQVAESRAFASTMTFFTGGLGDFEPVDPSFYMFWMVVSLSIVLQTLISMCYRFDFTNGAALTLPAVAEEKYEEETTTFGRLVHLPRRTSANFSKPYFLTSIGACIIAHLVVLSAEYMGLATVFEDVAVSKDLTYGILASLVSLPSMVFAILGLAAMKGDLRKIWLYEEEWVNSINGFEEADRKEILDFPRWQLHLSLVNL